jgi:hypothetical protein
MHEVRVGGSLHANSGDLFIAAVAGLGVVYEPDFMVAPALAAGQLVRLMPAFHGRRSEMWAVYPSRRHLSVKVRLFVDHVAAYFRPPVSAAVSAGQAPARSGPRAGAALRPAPPSRAPRGAAGRTRRVR